MAEAKQRQSNVSHNQPEKAIQSSPPRSEVPFPSGRPPRKRVSFFYTLGLLLVAVAMTTLPLVYLAMIGSVVYACYWHAVHNAYIFQSDRLDPRAQILKLAVYLCPFVVGLVIVFFMLKPLFAKREQQDIPLTLHRSQEPLLFDFVERLCQTCGAPVPREIHVSCEPNAGAGLRRGLLSLFIPGDVVLVLGLPLVNALTVQQLAGVLAHEFGHFSQGTAQRLTYLIFVVNRWFYRLVYERDEWDLSLIYYMKDPDSRLGLLLQFARLCIWLSRKVLWLLMLVGHMISCFMLRQQEYDADRQHAELVGSGSFEIYRRKIMLLQAAWHQADFDLQRAWQEKKLADNLPLLVAKNAESANAEIVEEIEQKTLEQTTRLFDTHPSSAARIKRVKERPTEGLFRCDLPATRLFTNLKMASHAVTIAYYKREIGLQVDPKNLVPTEQLFADRMNQVVESQVQSRYFLGLVGLADPWFPGIERIAAPAKPREALARLKAARDRITSIKPKLTETLKSREELDENLAKAIVAKGAVRIGLLARAKELGLANPTPEEADRACDVLLRQRAAIASQLAAFSRVIRVRLVTALSLAAVPQVAARIDRAAELRERADTVLPTLARMETVVTMWQDICHRLTLLNFLLYTGSRLEHKIEEQCPLLPAVAQSTAEDIHASLEEIKSSFGTIPYPFEHAAGNVSVRHYLMPYLLPKIRPGYVFPVADKVVVNMADLYRRCMGALALLAEQVERVLKLEPLAGPPPAVA